MEDNTKKSDLPKFKYHSDPLKTKSIELEETDCPVCGKHSDYCYVGPLYSRETVEGICPWCIADGSAAKKYDGQFNSGCDGVDNDEFIDELIHRTPGFCSVQGGPWMSHCGDYCEFIAKIGQVSNIGINEFLKDIVSEDMEKVTGTLGVKKEEIEEYMEKNGYLEGYLFRCLKCGKMRLYIDAE